MYIFCETDVCEIVKVSKSKMSNFNVAAVALDFFLWWHVFII